MPKQGFTKAVDGKKECIHCHEVKPFSEFPTMSRPARSGSVYYNPRCTPCNRIYHSTYYRNMTPEQKKEMSRKATLAKYGLTPEEYDVMFAEQNGLCAVCGRPPEGNGVSRHNLVVDHDHDTGETRSLLCDFCNRGLGIFRDDPDLLMAAAAYLLQYRREGE
jgi:hypothetical protein